MIPDQVHARFAVDVSGAGTSFSVSFVGFALLVSFHQCTMAIFILIIRRKNVRRLRTFQQSSAVSDIGYQWTGKYCHSLSVLGRGVAWLGNGFLSVRDNG